MRKRTDAEAKQMVQHVFESTNLGAKLWAAFDSCKHGRVSMDDEFRKLMNGNRYAKGWDRVLDEIGWPLFEAMYYLKDSIREQRIAQLLDLVKGWDGPPRAKAVVLPFDSGSVKRERKTKRLVSH
ncbi:MAG TPA: hypothetical protein VJW20_16915 [Candidatus Angelobacter sp.]|nr:hypothetical protein [Candidatus Angelobacter sp.]